MNEASPTSGNTSTTMVIPLPLNLANARLHWAAKVREKRAYWDSLTARKQARIIPAPPSHWPAKAKVEVTQYVWQRQDLDNAYGRCKWILDWLSGHGYIAGDREDQIELTVKQEVDRKNQRVKVVITPVECAVQE